MNRKNMKIAIALAMVSMIPCAYAALTDNLVHYYTFDSGTFENGWLPAAGVYVLPGAAEGTLTTGKIGAAMGQGSVFKGAATMVGEYFHPGTGDWTLSVWVKQAPLTGPRTILKRGAGQNFSGDRPGGDVGGWHLSRNTDGTLTLAYGAGNGIVTAPASTVALPDDIWGHLIIRREGSAFQVYLNNTLAIDVTLESPGFDLSAKLSVQGGTWFREFASGPNSDSSLRAGDALDELAVWTRALSAAEMLFLYNEDNGNLIETAPLRDGLLQYFPLDSDFSAAAGSGDMSAIGGTSDFVSEGKFNQSLLIAGSGNGKIYSSPTDNTRFHPGYHAWTIAFWYQPPEDLIIPEGGESIISRGARLGETGANWNAGWNLYMNESRNLCLRFFEGIGQSAGNVKVIASNVVLPAADEWVHLAITRSYRGMTLYVNGMEAGNMTVSNGAAIEVKGAPQNTYGRELETRGTLPAKIDELAFWNRALSIAELQRLLNAETTLDILIIPETLQMRTLGDSTGYWSDAVWTTPNNTVPGVWSSDSTDADITLTSETSRLDADINVELESLLFKSMQASPVFLDFSGYGEIAFTGLFPVFSANQFPAGSAVTVNAPIRASSVLEVNAPVPDTNASGGISFSDIRTPEISLKTGFLHLPDTEVSSSFQIERLRLNHAETGILTTEAVTRTFGQAVIVNESALIRVAENADSTLTLSESFSGNGDFTKTGEGTLEFTGSGTFTGNMNLKGGRLALSGGSHTADSLNIASGEMEIKDGTTLTIGRLSGVVDSNSRSIFTQTGGDIFITGNNSSDDGAHISCVLGVWYNGSAMYNMTGGSLRVPNATIRLAQDSQVDWSLNNATVFAQGITVLASNTRSCTITANAGSHIMLGSTGLRLNPQQTLTLNNDATLTFSANSTSTRAPTISGENTVIDLSGHRVALPGIGGNGKVTLPAQQNPSILVLNDSSSGQPDVTVGAGHQVIFKSSAPVGSGIMTLAEDVVVTAEWPMQMGRISGVDADTWKTASPAEINLVEDFSLISVNGNAVANNTVVVYLGRFYVDAAQAGQPWHFAGSYDDNILMRIDGVQIFESPDYNTAGTGFIENMTAGWHTFEIRARDISGADGPHLGSWKNNEMAVGYRVGSAPPVPQSADSYTPFFPDRIPIQGVPDGIFELRTAFCGGIARFDDTVALKKWHVHLGADLLSTRITTFDTTIPPDLEGCTVTFTADDTLMAGGYRLGRFRNADKAVFSGLPPGATIKIDSSGTVSVGNFALKIILF